MAQADYVVSNGTGAAVRADLNGQLAAIVTNNSGATSPATTYAYQWWADTTTNTLKLRNSANSAWIEIMQLDGTLTMEDGTAALPGLAFRDDLDTGIFRAGTNQLGISSAGVERVEFGSSEVVFNDAGNNYDFRVEGDTDANLLFVDASADAVGIATSSPSSLLHLNVASGASDGTRGVRISNPAGTTAMFECGSLGDSYVGTVSGSAFSIRTNNTPRITLKENGNILFQKTGESLNLEGLQFVTTSGVGITKESGAPLTLNRQTDNGNAIEFYRGTTSTLGSLVGSVSVTTTSTAYNTSSDHRLKENVAPLINGITRLQQLKPNRFNFIADPDKTVDGFIAHEVQDIVPEAIHGEKDAVDDEGNPIYQGIDQSKLVPLLTAALQEAVAKIETLEARLTAAGIE